MTNINEIKAIKVKIEHFIPLSDQKTEFIEFNLDGVTTSYKERGKRKVLDIMPTFLDRDEMKSFFEEIYDFIRNASEEDLLTDDLNCEVEIIYSPAHREILDGNTLRGTELLIDKLQKFVDDHRK